MQTKELESHLEQVRLIYEADRKADLAGVHLPGALEKKYPSASKQFGAVLNSYEFKARVRSGEVRNIHMSISMIPEIQESVASLIDMTDRNITPGRFVKITVTETGVGMDEATKARIFEPFFSTKQRGRGTGLGLASVYGIIKNHGGFILVESQKAVGTSFMVHLSASTKSAEHVRQVDKFDSKRHGYGAVH